MNPPFFSQVLVARDEMQWGEDGPPPLLVKIAPDLAAADLEDIAAVALAVRLDGLIISNTTIARSEKIQAYQNGNETGGLSGPPLLDMSTKVQSDMYQLTKGKIPIVGCGGVSSGKDAYRKIRAGASLVQLYTALVYKGPKLLPDMKVRAVAMLFGHWIC